MSPRRRLGRRYRVLSSLGRGSFGEVFRVHDEVLDRELALKRFHAAGLAPESREILREEFLLLTKLRHRGIPQVFDASLSGDELFFTMEYLRGPDLCRGLRSGGHGPLPEERLADAITAFLTMLSTLRYIHARGVFHGDLKPGNVLFREPAAVRQAPGGDVVLVDFGLHLPRLRRHGVTGTLDYLAPEQFSSGVLDAATNLFSLGVLFYEVLAGRLPWEGGDPLARVQEGGGAAPSLAAQAPQVPAALADVVHRLLSADRSLRYQSAEEVQRDLLLVEGRDESEAGAVLCRDFQFDPGLVGRESLQAQLREQVAVARKSGRGRVMGLAAERGLGGARLQRGLREQVQASGGLVLTCNAGRGVQATFEEILARLDAVAGDQDRRSRRALRQGLQDLGTTDGGDLSARRLALFERLARWSMAGLARKAAGNAEVLWVLQEMHRADTLTRELISRLAAGAPALPGLVLLVGQGGEWLEELEPGARMVLEGLELAAVREVLEANFPGLQAPDSVAAAVQERVHGNLLLLELLVTELAHSGGFVYRARGWSADIEAIRTCQLPESAAQAVQERLDALAPGQRRLLAVAGLMGERVRPGWVAAASQLGLSDVQAAFDEWTRLDLMEREENGMYRLLPPASPELLGGSLPPSRRRAARSAAADHLRGELAAGDRQACGPLAELCVVLRRPEEAARLFDQLGRDARVRLEPEAALRYLTRSADLLRRARRPAPDALLESLEEVALLLGRYQEARDVQRRRLRRCAKPAQAPILVRLARVEQLLGDHEAARRRVQAALNLTPAAKLGAAGIEANRILAKVARSEGNYQEAERLYDEAITLAEKHPGEVLIRVLTSQGEFFLRRGEPERAEACFRRCLELAGTGKERYLLPGIQVGMGQLWMDRNPGEAVEALQKAAELAREHAQIPAEVDAHYNLGIVFTDLAQLGRARESYQQARELVRRKHGVMQARIEAQLGNLARERGDFPQADEHYRRFQERASGLAPGSPIRLLHRVNRALLMLSRGEPGAGLKDLRAAEPDYTEAYPRAFMAYQRTRARLELEAGDREQAQRRAVQLAQLAEQHQDRYFRIGAAMLEGELARHGADPRAGLEKLLEARRQAVDMGNRKIEGEISLLVAELLLERPELGEDPRPHLAQARDILGSAGMRPALERAARLTLRLEGAPGLSTQGPQRTEKELKTFYRLSDAILKRQSMDDLFSLLLDTAIELMNAERGLLFLTREGSRRLEPCASRRSDRAVQRDAGQISRNILKATVKDAAPVFSTNAMTDERFRGNRSVLNYGIRSFICVPLLLPKRVLGTLYVDHRKLDSLFGQSDADFLMAYANFAAAAIDNALSHDVLAKQVEVLRGEMREKWDPDNMVGDSPAMQEVRRLIAQVAPTSSTVLVRGESGTGKELVARALHEQSPRGDGPLVALNCAALPETLVEAELFGTVLGAYTDGRERAGKFETAQGGTLFLDEIGDLSLSAQAKILRAIESRQIERLGSDRAVEVDIRLVTATHSDLESSMRSGSFREDLYYRLNVMEIHIPPLRERREDVALLVRHFVTKFCREQARSPLAVGHEVLSSYLQYDWPGNVRELRNALERAVLLAQGDELPPFVPPSARERGATDLQLAFERGDDEQDVKRAYARLVYQRLGGNKRRACRVLGIDFKTLQSRLTP